MPKVSDYELAHVDEEFEQKQKFRKKNKVKVEKKYPNKKEYRKVWKKQIENLEDVSDNSDEESE